MVLSYSLHMKDNKKSEYSVYDILFLDVHACLVIKCLLYSKCCGGRRNSWGPRRMRYVHRKL